ncbi:MAG: UDP-2,3-diacylglucosamine diphosphatase LpxI [Planctomycetales bacterium]
MGHWFRTRNPDAVHRLDRPQFGLVAGWGQYPLVVAEALRRQGRRLIGVGVRGHCDPALAKLCDEFQWSGLGGIGRAIRFFRRHRVAEATMAGKIFKTRLFQRWAWFRHCPDFRTLRMFLRTRRRKNMKDDTLLGAVADEFAQDGILFLPATDFAPELLVKSGRLTRLGPTPAQQRDVEFGWKLAKEMGRLDVGQSVVVKDRAALAIEAIEGTDDCIRRAGTLCPAGGFTLVKVAKPQQDMRFDVPTIGLGTLETLVASGGKVLAIEAERTIVLEEEEVVRFANRSRLIIVAFKTDEQGALVSP